MSEGEINVSDVIMDSVDSGVDPFDEVVEYEPTTEAEGSDPFDEVDEGNSESEESQEEPKEEENSAIESEDGEKDPETSESEEKDAEEGDKESEDDSENEVSVDDLNSKIEDGSLEVKINDEDSATLQDLKNSYIGQKEISRRFTEYDVKNKQLEKDTTEINGYINEFASKLKDGDSIGAMSYFGEFAGVAPYMIKEQLIAALRPEIIRREQMTATEVQNEYLSNQNEYLQEQQQSDIKRREADLAQREVDTSINEIRETNGIDEQTWTDTYSSLEKNLPEGTELTPELVAETVNFSRMYNQAEKVIDSSGENLENREQWIEELVDVKSKYPDFTEEDLQEVLKTALETVNKGVAEQKLAKKLDSKKETVSKKQPKQTKPIEEDLDPELEDWL